MVKKIFRLILYAIGFIFLGYWIGVEVHFIRILIWFGMTIFLLEKDYVMSSGVWFFVGNIPSHFLAIYIDDCIASLLEKLYWSDLWLSIFYGY